MKRFLKSILITFATLTLMFTVNYAMYSQPVSAQIGTIDPRGLPKTSDPNQYVSRFVRGIITVILIVAFIMAFIWIILAGLKFILAGGDPKEISMAWSRIYYGIIGLVVIMGSFAIIKIVEYFFKIEILSKNLALPRI